MSFHKRFYTWDRIKQKTSSTFNEFDMWLYKPDAHILQDNESADFFGAYFALPGDKLKEDLYESLKVEEETFLKDLIKCIKVYTRIRTGKIMTKQYKIIGLYSYLSGILKHYNTKI